MKKLDEIDLDALMKPSAAMLSAGANAISPLDAGLLFPSEEAGMIWTAMVEAFLLEYTCVSKRHD
jgi:hypothetical protein